jgi:hypothetical protein
MVGGGRVGAGRWRSALRRSAEVGVGAGRWRSVDVVFSG